MTISVVRGWTRPTSPEVTSRSRVQRCGDGRPRATAIDSKAQCHRYDRARAVDLEQRIPGRPERTDAESGDPEPHLLTRSCRNSA